MMGGEDKALHDIGFAGAARSLAWRYFGPGICGRGICGPRTGVGRAETAADFVGHRATRYQWRPDQGRLGIIPRQNTGKTMSEDDIKAELERLRRENAALKKGASSGIRMKVSEKGAVSIYGMGRFPVTLYKEQWIKLLDMSDDIRAFIAANESQLKAKE